MKKTNLIPLLLASFSVIFWGASFVATKIALRYIAADLMVWVRFAMGLVVLGLAVAARKQFRLPRRADLPYFALLGFIGITFHQLLQSNGLMTAQATTSSWIIATGPIFIAMMGWLALKEKLTGFQAAGIVFALLGVLLIVSKGDLRGLVGGENITYGDILVMISSPNWALFSILSRRGLKQHPATLMMFYVMAFGWGFTSLLFLFNPNGSGIPSLPLDGWISVLFLGIFCSGLAYIFWYDALQSLPASQVGVFLYLEPLITVIIAWGLLGERLTWASLLGGAIILTGVWMVNRPAAKPQPQPVPVRQEI